ncbi:MAG: hypothetical protein IJ389_02320 [Clostridia bacterium]|nr:hypothetical protein [Oscillospiraceae bacterium]MBQ7836069.1 hypothetical protein [Clostridia bacterium]
MPRKVKNGTKYALLIIVNFIWMFVVYRAILMLSEHYGTLIPYIICASVYLVASAFLLGFYYFSTSGETDPVKKEKYKPMLLWAFPIVTVLLLDVLEAVVLDYFINLFS